MGTLQTGIDFGQAFGQAPAVLTNTELVNLWSRTCIDSVKVMSWIWSTFTFGVDQNGQGSVKPDRTLTKTVKVSVKPDRSLTKKVKVR